ncbi:MAG: GNAT family N-acetyltransferase [Defluviitaleaceae bacterium]|nr:GNAT family N-acetyltransferase [Defluviitaleaceae bacterium]
MRYRQAEAGDINILTQLLAELYETQAPSISYEELLRENLAHFENTNQIFFLAFDGYTAIGVCHASLRNEYVNGKEFDAPCGYLEAVYVRKSHQRQGIASKLVEYSEDWARKNGCREFLSDCLLDNVDSFNFHLKLGFVEAGRCIFFRKELACIAGG